MPVVYTVAHLKRQNAYGDEVAGVGANGRARTRLAVWKEKGDKTPIHDGESCTKGRKGPSGSFARALCAVLKVPWGCYLDATHARTSDLFHKMRSARCRRPSPLLLQPLRLPLLAVGGTDFLGAGRSEGAWSEDLESGIDFSQDLGIALVVLLRLDFDWHLLV